MRVKILAPFALLAVAGAALAQDAAEDWEVVRQPEEKAVFAFVPTSTGLTIGLRCLDGAYGAVIGGLPEAPRNAKIRPLRIRINDEEARLSSWNVTTDRTVALADYPASFARALREGGAVSITIPDGAGDGRNLRHDLELPGSSAAIDETLTACNRPTEDPRDALLPEITESGLPDGVTWERQPNPSFPNNNYQQGYAVITCVVLPEGSLDQCEIESEFPTDGRFGRNALRGTRSARIASPGETLGQYAPRIIGFRVNFQMR